MSARRGRCPSVRLSIPFSHTPHPFATFRSPENRGDLNQALGSTLPFDQNAILEENMAYIRDSLAVDNVLALGAVGEEGDARRKASAEPGRPTLFLFKLPCRFSLLRLSLGCRTDGFIGCSRASFLGYGNGGFLSE